MNKKQKDIFLDGEGDAWHERNHAVLEGRSYGLDDPVIRAVLGCLSLMHAPGKLIEVGCGEGGRLRWLSNHKKMDCHGLDPSAKAVGIARQYGVNAIQGVASDLPYEEGSFDIVVFGFCLYLCDRDDLFRIAQEAHRILKPQGWVIIHDFFASSPGKREYHHLPGVFSYKMDYRKLFDWHSSYTCFSHEIDSHSLFTYTDDSAEWVATSVLRKNSIL